MAKEMKREILNKANYSIIILFFFVFFCCLTKSQNVIRITRGSTGLVQPIDFMALVLMTFGSRASTSF
jgi:hypothetical protein